MVVIILELVALVRGPVFDERVIHTEVSSLASRVHRALSFLRFKKSRLGIR